MEGYRQLKVIYCSATRPNLEKNKMQIGEAMMFPGVIQQHGTSLTEIQLVIKKLMLCRMQKFSQCPILLIKLFGN